MEKTKRCPVGLDSFQHYCPDDPKNHEPLTKIKSYLERKFEGKTEADISNEPWRREHWATLQFIRGGCKGERPKTQLAEAQTPSKAEAPTITPTQQEAMNAIAQLRAGVPFTRSYPQAVIPRQPKIVTFEQEILHNWETNSSIRAEFVSLSSYQACMKAQRGARQRS
ncbi:MAG: hypothetical protein DYG83_10305 [Candidatus Brocadia sp. AMX2]|uniref:Uncharacterized protein n=1 Tax=Candidatus Brocadia sinica JPN1 TaxID=1197129 RepID=A0ABQ0JZ05_9BACT|nr:MULTISPECIES: hypothetical protein [Brocadia]MBC6932884.1 hypothetical protein [Candidatus Brocadia sp.]MBL1167630.1 hypothetical protein [Candidatus Brocadia sp. AMX1]NOG40478.1 hypothetical protein [Planctomycetota bacterium]NUO06270.1 hypothetical protein [Candidatus Brocadia sinica]KAA0242091.1 MAG: hypothetical protein EDM70_15705 [Candidatus Brocadia sp. AMX2]